MLIDPELVARMGELRTEMVGLVAVHEHADHGGMPCLGARASAVAFLMHSLGLGPAHWQCILAMLDQYAADCPHEGGDRP